MNKMQLFLKFSRAGRQFECWNFKLTDSGREVLYHIIFHDTRWLSRIWLSYWNFGIATHFIAWCFPGVCIRNCRLFHKYFFILIKLEINGPSLATFCPCFARNSWINGFYATKKMSVFLAKSIIELFLRDLSMQTSRNQIAQSLAH